VWTFPSRADCLDCHTLAAGSSLGLETRQLNRTAAYPGGRYANQLATLEHIGLLDAPLPSPPAQLPAFDAPFGSAPLETRARVYLHTNCSHCHRPDSTASVKVNFLYDTPAAAMYVCNVPPNQGYIASPSELLLTPGDPAKSILSLRMHATSSPPRMPKVGSNLVDPNGTALIDAWITAKTTCP
jgi:hypothetical protein